MYSALAPVSIKGGIVEGLIVTVKHTLVTIQFVKDYKDEAEVVVNEGDKTISFVLTPDVAKALVAEMVSLFGQEIADADPIG
jgi:hypothetical protein